MYSFIVILILIVCVLLAAVVLVQNSKGGGLAANFSAPNQIMGVRKTTETIEKITWWMFGILIVLCLIATLLIPRGNDHASLASDLTVTNATDVNTTPMAAPMATDAAPATEE